MLHQDTLHIPRLSPNSKPHPTREGYLVYYFPKQYEADYFESLLKERNLFYEAATQDNETLMKYLFGVRISDQEEINQLNFLTKGKFRKNLMPVKWFAYLIIIFGMSLLLLAIVGAFISQ